MANDFVRNIKGVRNIDKLSRNITTENDLISTNDNEVYVVTNGGYKRITGGETEQDIELLEKDVKNLKTSTDNNTSEIETLKTSTDSNTSDIETLKTSTTNNETNIDSTQTLIEQLQTQIDDLKSNTKQYYTLFEGSANAVGTVIPLNDNLDSFDLIYISGVYPVNQIFTETILLKSLTDTITIGRTNLKDTTGVFLGAYEIKLTINNNQELEITNDVSWDELGSVGSGLDRNAFTITNIEGVK